MEDRTTMYLERWAHANGKTCAKFPFLSSLLPLGSLVWVTLKSGAKFKQRCTRAMLGLSITDYQPRYIVYQLSTINKTRSSDKPRQK